MVFNLCVCRMKKGRMDKWRRLHISNRLIDFNTSHEFQRLDFSWPSLCWTLGGSGKIRLWTFKLLPQWKYKSGCLRVDLYILFLQRFASVHGVYLFRHRLHGMQQFNYMVRDVLNFYSSMGCHGKYWTRILIPPPMTITEFYNHKLFNDQSLSILLIFIILTSYSWFIHS